MNTDLPGAKWFKSSRSSVGRDCVEIAHLAGGLVGVRDSKNPSDPALVCTGEAWDAFLSGIATGRFDPS